LALAQNNERFVLKCMLLAVFVQLLNILVSFDVWA
jgi:hypothetical protein